jgi:NADPH-dependent 2,4-dienoyl-CoA reductase/sulfur reductase-like enzyme/rhodanese-related sulfurtransferase
MNQAEKLSRVVIIGAVAAGASCAARLRRLNEHLSITLIERGPDVSFANCGLPYYIGGEIKERSALALQTPESLRDLLHVEVKVRHEARSIDRNQQLVHVCDLTTGHEIQLPYDRLILAPGAAPLRPNLPGIDSPGIFALRNLQDMDRIREASDKASSALIVGAGFIGLEMAEQLKHIGKTVEVVELQNQVLPPLDPEMAAPIAKTLESSGIRVRTGQSVLGFEPTDQGIRAKLSNGETIQADMVILSIGVRPESQLAREAGLELGERGHIRVNAFLQTSDPKIYAAGDVAETTCPLSTVQHNVPLGGPANRQGRAIAEHLVHPEWARPYPGSLGTAILRANRLAAGITGLSEKRLRQLNMPYERSIITDFHHASYYPGATPLTLKILYCPKTLRLFGAQAYGENGVDKRLDVMATALRAGMTLEDLEHLELSYAPPFGSAKDPVNTVAFAALNATHELVQWTWEQPDPNKEQVVDVRPPAFREAAPFPGALAIPLPELRKRLNEIDPTKPVVTLCKLGKMSYFAARILKQHGYQVKSYAGGVSVEGRAV